MNTSRTGETIMDKASTPRYSDYFIDLPNLGYDRSALLGVADQLDDRWARYRRKNGELASYDELRYDGFEEFPQIAHIMDQLNPALRISSGRMAFVRLPPNNELEAHLDNNRQAALMFPLCPDDAAPVYYLDDDGNEAISLRYSHPTIMHAQRMHGVRNTDAVRINFQMSIYHTWDDLLRMASEDDILVRR